jgi:hypothetical protein
MKNWVVAGLVWGAFMFLIMNIVFPLCNDKKISGWEMLIDIPLWIIGGLIFGYLSRKKTVKNNENEKVG